MNARVAALVTLALLSSCGRSHSKTEAPVPQAKHVPTPFLARKGMDKYLASHPKLALDIERARMRSRSASGDWTSKLPFWGPARLHVTIDRDNLVVMEAVAPGGRVLTWARGTVLSRTPAPSGSLVDAKGPLAPFAKWSVKLDAMGPVLIGGSRRVPMLATRPAVRR